MLPKTRVVELVVVLIALAVLIGTKSINNHFKDKMIVPIPIELILVILATIITHYAGLIDKYGVTVVGAIPSGFRAPVIPDASYFSSIVGDAFSLAIVSYTINIALAKTFALKHGYKVDNNQEMIAVGLSNGIGSFFFCFNVSSSLARSLVQDSTGCKTQVTGVVSSIVMMIVILKIGSLFQELPVAVLAAIVLVNLTLLFMQFTDVYTLWKTNKIDMVVWLVTFACTILLNLDIGLAAAVGFSLFVYIIRSQLPRYYILGLVPDTALYLDIETYKEAKEIPGIKIFSTSATLYHINAQRFTEALEKKTGFDLEKLLTTKRKRDEALKRKEEKEIKKAKKLAKNQNQLNRRLFSGIFALKKSKIEEGGFPAELSGQNQVNLTDFKQAGISTIDLGTGQVNWAYQHDLGPGDNNLPPVTYHGDEDKGSSSESRTHSIILDISKTSFVDINTVNVLKKIFSDFGELDVAIYLSGCQACVVKQLDTAGFFSEQIPKSRLFVTVHDAVLYVLKTQTQKDVILDVPCYTQM